MGTTDRVDIKRRYVKGSVGGPRPRELCDEGVTISMPLSTRWAPASSRRSHRGCAGVRAAGARRAPVGARWAIELWCTPPAVEMSLRMPPGSCPASRLRPPGPDTGSPVNPGVTAPRCTWCTAGAVAARTSGCSSNRSSRRVTGSSLSTCPAITSPIQATSRQDAPPSSSAPKRCGPSWTRHGPARGIVAHSLGAKAAALAVARGIPVERLVFLAPMGDFSLYLDLFAERHGFGPRIRTGLHRRLDRRLGMPLFDTDIPAMAARTTIRRRCCSSTIPTTPTAPMRRARDSSRLAGRELDDHPWARTSGALPHPAASPRNQRRDRFHRQGDLDSRFAIVGSEVNADRRGPPWPM